MNYVKNDDGQWVIAVGAPNSLQRIAVMYPKTIYHFCDTEYSIEAVQQYIDVDITTAILIVECVKLVRASITVDTTATAQIEAIEQVRKLGLFRSDYHITNSPIGKAIQNGFPLIKR